MLSVFKFVLIMVEVVGDCRFIIVYGEVVKVVMVYVEKYMVVIWK